MKLMIVLEFDQDLLSKMHTYKVVSRSVLFIL